MKILLYCNTFWMSQSTCELNSMLKSWKVLNCVTFLQIWRKKTWKFAIFDITRKVRFCIRPIVNATQSYPHHTPNTKWIFYSGACKFSHDSCTFNNTVPKTSILWKTKMKTPLFKKNFQHFYDAFRMSLHSAAASSAPSCVFLNPVASPHGGANDFWFCTKIVQKLQVIAPLCFCIMGQLHFASEWCFL